VCSQATHGCRAAAMYQRCTTTAAPKTSRRSPATPLSGVGPHGQPSSHATSLCVLALVLVERDPMQSLLLLDEASAIAPSPVTGSSRCGSS
jgi:hypothetical protein